MLSLDPATSGLSSPSNRTPFRQHRPHCTAIRSPGRSKRPEHAAHRRGDERPKDGPVPAREPLLDEDEAAALVRVTVVDGTEQEDGEDAAEAAGDHLEAAPPEEVLVPEAEDEHRG